MNKITYNYSYDSTGRSVKTVKTAVFSSGSLSVWSDYDNANNKAFKTLVTGGRTYRHEAVYNSDNRLTGYTVSVDKGNGSSNLASFTYAYDGLGRVVRATNSGAGQNVSTEYTYKASGRENGSGYTTTLLETETTGSAGYKYEYDSLGNITKIYRKSGSSWVLSNSYEYDSLSELIRENDVNNNFTHIFTYDANGNILCRDEYAYTAAASVAYTKTVNGTAVTTIRPNGCTPVKSVVYTYGTGTDNVSTNGINGDYSIIMYYRFGN